MQQQPISDGDIVVAIVVVAVVLVVVSLGIVVVVAVIAKLLDNGDSGIEEPREKGHMIGETATLQLMK